MANPEISEARLVDARVYVTSKQTELRGAGPDDFFSIEIDGDISNMTSGIQGDAMLVGLVRNGYVGTFTFLGYCSGVTKLLELAGAGAPFVISVNYNDFSINGVATVRSPGAWIASAGSPTRTIVLNIVAITGNQETGIGKKVVAT